MKNLIESIMYSIATISPILAIFFLIYTLFYNNYSMAVNTNNIAIIKEYFSQSNVDIGDNVKKIIYVDGRNCKI